MLLGAVVFRWTRDLFGPNAALLALALYAFDPNLIAHSRLSTTDLGLAATMTIAMWRLWAWLEKPTRWNLVWVGVAAGAAMATKFTGLDARADVCAGGVGFTRVGSNARRVDESVQPPCWRLAVVGLVALLVVWAVYGFEIRDGLPAATYWRGTRQNLDRVFAGLSHLPDGPSEPHRMVVLFSGDLCAQDALAHADSFRRWASS